MDLEPKAIGLFLNLALAIINLQSVRLEPSMSFEAYKKLKMSDPLTRNLYDFIAYFQGYRVSMAEKESVSDLLRLAFLSVSLSNDTYNFNRLFERHAKDGTLSNTQNGVSLLMHNYGYSEDEARQILKQEVLVIEEKLLEGYRKWEGSDATKSDDLRIYVVLLILATGGYNYWQASCAQGSSSNAAASTEDGARSIGRCSDKLLHLEGYPGPVGFSQAVPPGPEACSSSPNAPNIETIRGNEEPKKLRNEKISEHDILAPFQKADGENICMKPFDYTRSLPGKDTVSKVIMSLRPWLNVSDTSVLALTDIMIMLQNSSLMLDDIEDGSQLRRGAPAAHVKYGLSQTVNSTTYVLAKVFFEAQKGLRPDCMRVLCEELQTLTMGQGLDLHLTFNKKCPSVREYLVMIDHKTGGFFRLMLRVMEIEADGTPNPDLQHLITLLGRYYQIKDDYQNLASNEYTAKKGFCDDLSEGKFSFPLIHLLENSPNTGMLYKLIFERESGYKGDISEETKEFILSEMRCVGSLEHTLDVLTNLFNSIWETVVKVEETLGSNKKFKALCLLLKL
ncbi:hypothetical protein BBP40_008718 [Aspergillus hancockii]|nr:hypothetical protein BBP40_008718 [Aspergillus hancockii]